MPELLLFYVVFCCESSYQLLQLSKPKDSAGDWKNGLVLKKYKISEIFCNIFERINFLVSVINNNKKNF